MRRSPLIIALTCTAATTTAADPAIVVSGYVETHYQLNLRAPSNGITALRGFDNRDRAFTLDNVALDAKGTTGPVTARLVLQVGTTGSSYYLAEPALPGASGTNATSSELWKYLQAATVAYTFEGGAVIDAGLFPSPIGAEVIPIKDNWNWSRSNLFFGLPFYHTGARAALPLGGGWTGMLHVYNGWNSVVDNNPYPSAGASASYADKHVTAQLLYFGGIERARGAPEGNAWRNLFDAAATVAVTDEISVQGQLDVGFELNDFGTSGWYAGAAAAKYALSPELYVAARADYFREYVAGGAAAIFWPTRWIASGTATLAWQPAPGVSVRLEARHDEAADRVFYGGGVTGDGVMVPYVPNRRRQDTVTLGAVAWF